jgi:hypothetical protein
MVADPHPAARANRFDIVCELTGSPVIRYDSIIVASTA